MKKLLFLLTILVSFFSCKKHNEKEYVSIKSNPTVNWEIIQKYYYHNMVEALQYLDSLQTEGVHQKKTFYYFKELRKAFKKAEPYAAYLNPEVGHRANGPALPIYKDDSGKVVAPVGLQKLEETIYKTEGTQTDFDQEITILKGLLHNLKNGIKNRPLNPQRFFIAIHQQLMRLISFSMSGFDTPVSGLSIAETAVSLNSLLYVYQNSIQPIILEKDTALNTSFENNIKKALAFIHQNTDFASFDRYTFIRDYLNPITRNWVVIKNTSHLWNGSKAYPFNFDAPTFFEEDSFNTAYFLDVNDRDQNIHKIKLGEKLFFDKNLSATATVACATCHLPQKAYTDGLPIAIGNQGSRLKRNSPTLINSVYQRAFFWDGRAATLKNQIKSVFNSEQEFATKVHRFSENIIEKDSTYTGLFKKAFGKIPTSNQETVSAIAVYLSTLKGLNSKFDKNIRGKENTFTPSEKRGFNLFMGKALCATCHFVPLTNGTVPPFFNETEKEVIGVPETKAHKKWDDDLGFYWVFEEPLHKGMFKTPSIRNASLTAPYMHNGVYTTLEEVMDFYNQGGGAGLGFDIPHQTLPFDNLNLNKQELNDIIAFIKTLEDVPASY